MTLTVTAPRPVFLWSLFPLPTKAQLTNFLWLEMRFSWLNPPLCYLNQVWIEGAPERQP